MNETNPSEPGLIEIIRHNRLATVGFLFFAAALLLPIWIVHFPPLLDYPNHLASSFVLGHLHDPSYDFSRYYAADWNFRPYITTDFVMDVLGRIMPPLVGGKLVLSLGALGVPLAAWFFLRQANPGQDSLAFWYLLAGHNIFFRYGFVGFYWSLALLFLTLGLWLRYLKEPSVSRWLVTCLALTATFFTHIMGFFFAGLIMGIYSLTRPRLREWIRSAALYAPGIICYFAASRVVEHQSDGGIFRTFSDKLDTFWLILHGNSDLLDEISLAAVVALFILGWAWNREFKWQWRWVAVAIGVFITFAALPVGYGDGYEIDIRALPVLFISLFVIARFGRRGWWFVPLAILLFTARTYDLTKNFRAAQPELSGLAQSFTMTPPNARVLPMVAGYDEDPILQFYAHFWAYGVIERGWFSPYLFQIPGLLPLRITADTYTLDDFWDLSYDEKVDWAQVQDDYDYVWAYNVPKFDSGLQSIGEMIYKSGKLEFFRIRKVAAPPPAPPPPRNKPLSRRKPLETTRSPAAR